jgi:class 3 adenylate cyclase
MAAGLGLMRLQSRRDATAAPPAPDFRHPATYEVSLLQFDIAGFTAMSADVGPRVVLELLDRLYASFDRIVAKRGGLKVAIIGDAILVAAGVPDRLPLHVSARAIAKMAIDMMRTVETFTVAVGSKLKGHRLNARIGIHCGEVLAGIIGDRMPQFQVFGRAVDECQLMESSGELGHVHASADILRQLELVLAPVVPAGTPRRGRTTATLLSRLSPSVGALALEGGAGSKHPPTPTGSKVAPAPSSTPAAVPGAVGSGSSVCAASESAATAHQLPDASRSAAPDIRVVRRLPDGTGFVARDRSAALNGIAW